MASAQDVQTLLRFLSQDAKMPLAQAMGKVKVLQEARLITPTEIAKADFEGLSAVFEDEKIARQVLNAAKRVSKKRTASMDVAQPTDTPPAATKKAKPLSREPMDGATLEASLSLPEPELDENRLKDVVLFTNRAPLVLAFAIAVLKHTMPDQPLSSRLSLAQAVCSANSQTKARTIGIQRNRTAEEEGWGEGQPLIKVLHREIRVMKRWGYMWRDSIKEEPSSTQDSENTIAPDEPALWGVDLEALKKSNGPVTVGGRKPGDLPIYRPENTRAYLLKSFGSNNKTTGTSAAAKKKASLEKEQNLGMLLGALELLCQSWLHILSKEDLDDRAWGWYCSVRPQVKSGIAGWGGKGNVALADILALRRPG